VIQISARRLSIRLARECDFGQEAIPRITGLVPAGVDARRPALLLASLTVD
jgi:hypothetical protein